MRAEGVPFRARELVCHLDGLVPRHVAELIVEGVLPCVLDLPLVGEVGLIGMHPSSS